MLSLVLLCPHSLISLESQQKRTRERPKQSQPRERPSARPQQPRKNVRPAARPQKPQKKARPSARPQEPRKKVRPSARPQTPRRQEQTKPKPTVPRRRQVPTTKDEGRDQKRVRPKPSERATPRQPGRDQATPRVAPEVRPSPRQPVKERRPTEQELAPNERELRTPIRREHQEIFNSAERAFSRASIRSMTSHLAPKVYISISGGESGYFSANQAHYILDNYFGSHRPVTFSFNTFGESSSNPYATGRGSIVYRGSRQDVQVYVSLTQAGSRWVISQVNIY